MKKKGKNREACLDKEEVKGGGGGKKHPGRNQKFLGERRAGVLLCEKEGKDSRVYGKGGGSNGDLSLKTAIHILGKEGKSASSRETRSKGGRGTGLSRREKGARASLLGGNTQVILPLKKRGLVAKELSETRY